MAKFRPLVTPEIPERISAKLDVNTHVMRISLRQFLAQAKLHSIFSYLLASYRLSINQPTYTLHGVIRTDLVMFEIANKTVN